MSGKGRRSRKTAPEVILIQGDTTEAGLPMGEKMEDAGQEEVVGEMPNELNIQVPLKLVGAMPDEVTPLPEELNTPMPEEPPIQFPPKPILVRQPATYGLPNDVTYDQKMKQFEVSINRMEQMMTTILGSMQRDEPAPPVLPPVEEELPVINLADWPVQKPVPEPYDAIHSRREYTTRSMVDVYANEIDENVDENIVLTDASASRWGAASRMQTNVGMRTRGLWLNPTLQQPSIGGLV